MEDLKNELTSFASDLDTINKETESARQETEKIGAPRAAKTAQEELIDFYTRSGRQTQDLRNVVKFMNQLFEVAVIFDNIKQDTKLQEIQTMIAEAKTKSSGINTVILPEELKNSGNELKTAMDNFLEAIDETAAGKVEGNDRLNTSYADFSQKENDFFSGEKKYVDSFQDTGLIENQIDNELLVLERVRFSIK